MLPTATAPMRGAGARRVLKTVAVGVGSLAAGMAQAQSLSTSVDGNQPRLVVTPSVRVAYDSNILRNNDSVAGPKDNIRTTAGVDIIARRTFGRTAFSLAGSVGYDFNSRFKFLDRTRIELGGGIRTPIGAICSLKLSARYDQYQFDLSDVDQVIAATTRQQYYDALGSCNRAAGFSPLAGVTYSRRTSSSTLLSDSSTLSGRVGISYAQPSLGVVSLIASRARISRSGLPSLALTPDGTDISQVQLSLSRNVAPRLGFNIGVGYVDARPDRAAVAPFAGLSFNGEVTWRPAPRFVVTVSAGRDITSQNGINATYVIRDDYQAALNMRLTQRSRLRLAAAHIDRDFRGRELLPTGLGISRDKVDTATASYSYDTSRLLRFTLSASQRWRRADVSRYDYKSTVVAFSVGARF